MGKRIWQYPEATSISENDYLLLDNQTDGSKSIKANLVGSILIDKTVTERKTYTAADDNVDGYKKVIVDVPYTDVHYQKGDIVTFDDGEDLPLASLKTTIVPIQDLHGYDSPWVGGSGKNKLKVTATTLTTSGVTFTVNADGIISTSGTATGDIDFYVGAYTSTGDTYSASGCPSGGATDSTYWMFFGYMGADSGSGISNKTIASGNNITARIYVKNGTNMNGKVFKPMIEVGSTISTFAPYSNICPISGWDEVNIVVSPTTDAEDGHTYTIPFTDSQGNPIEVFGGELDVVSGVLTVDRVLNTIDQNSTIQFRSTGRALTFITDAYKTVTMGGVNIICDKLKSAYYSNYDSAQNGEIATVSGSTAQTGIVFKISDSITSLDELKAWLTSNPLTIVTNLATPLTIQLTPTSVKSLLGSNNVWGDCGPVAVEWQTLYVTPTE